MSIDVAVVRVFTDDAGRYGNPLGIVRSHAVPPAERQSLATELGFSETIFVDHDGGSTASAAIFTPAVELPFAGHPTVGLSWWLGAQGHPIDTLVVPAGELQVTYGDGTTAVRARADWAPEFTMHPLTTVDEVESVDLSTFTEGHHYVWAWMDAEHEAIRSRMFAPEMGIAEDEATGAAAVRITASLGLGIRIHQGRGSRLLTTCLDDGWIELGGRTVADSSITVR
ncbi:PhzF family phenazine biosynthesis protein [Rhodococcus sp. BP-252]|uniref:PhzF family phenazine biosynthesis protein n=1 Tax=unclassified Rhodococcus (in: high G+C Gram-positive bacteria) TaxID=192944 RepID=UPI001C9B923F|nr:MULTISPECIES: PhzF family phenazine biosynthesis protein [unclassified Rhodococcus (in: high G+C Gram-positive bacteria)]MBY6410973.1 PhzF family phenazine biosynthesis protein [Rhodococcus sp. BP-320]MBY6415632.1 PhzF family phenazine biosynthesis protein [Rhodococcus sp. BP-321]MBY6420986.1 PhzF family phenazine biosynthesis protein [Rhodococcus sp. BP-324]MBY6426041.1 PhzF family phenazine biosynthesis protein [Rhodococcus sp. BP-323]MBY6430838.1 PhzF family phenazine biosynthesis protei